VWNAERAAGGAINLAERLRDVGVQVVVAAQSVEGLAITARRRGSSRRALAGSWCSSARP
jgi:hypothetical protein